jgi:hypothetical protein
MANRIWQYHFGTGLVLTSDNLGYTGSVPSHPELLDFLAAELVRLGWRTKSLHRLIVTSSVYLQTSAPQPKAVRLDPANRLLAQFPLRRLDAEAIRDGMLAASGELDDRQGGPYVPTDSTGSGEIVVAESAPGAKRRSVYLQQRRTQTASLLEVFDAPSIVTTCTRRFPSTIPLQSLSLLNADFVVARAQKLADRIARDCKCGILPRTDPDARITRAFLLTAGRAPKDDERYAARQFLQTQPARYPACAETDAQRHTWTDFCQALLGSNAFLYVE